MLRKSDLFLLYIALCLLLVMGSVVHSSQAQRASSPLLQQRANMVRELGLTDLALFTEARYTRHLSQSDLHSAFQDHPMALEHFPSGSFCPPPRSLAR